MPDGALPADLDLRARMALELPGGLVEHIDRVVALADTLARHHGLEVPLARLMAQGHDLVRHVPPADLLARAEARGLPIDPVERDAPLLLHGPIGALELRERFGVTDARVFDAIWHHTWGHPDYTPEAWAMFIADKVEPHKVRRWKALRRVHRLALDVSLEAAALLYLDLRLKEAVREGHTVHPLATLTRNYLLRARAEA
ncbi:MAG: bis(5'-nucleosyl)-tetraphosphatase (symmetrical) YqeK [Chloroflexi bacterium]|nr:bis(5'-nucleosyl)-tetraphosphatase (symmetrical) YqeK [Chloroflexota bacterium]MDA1241091.1 bis(5'-nucleosyl)-tetraphosphatase (symmetrical) YqeK [Chloroflexota bacterium]